MADKLGVRTGQDVFIETAGRIKKSISFRVHTFKVNGREVEIVECLVFRV